MKYPIALLAAATVLLLVSLGIRMHAEGRYVDKMYYHTVKSTLYEFDDIFAERRAANAIQLCGVVAGVTGGLWFVLVKVRGKS